MFEMLISFLWSFRVYFRSRSDNQLEILALRHQIVLQRKTPKPKLKPADRRLWAWLSQCWPEWRSEFVMVKPATVIDWHRRGFRWYWTWKVRHEQVAVMQIKEVLGAPRCPWQRAYVERVIATDGTDTAGHDPS
jgi:hypothetical protein